MRCRSRPAGSRRATSTDKATLPLREALLLGVVHGPAELLPVSSSGHVAALSWLLGFAYPELEDEPRKSFEVALHAGAAAAWVLSPAGGGREALRAALAPTRDTAVVLGLATVPAAFAGLTLERPIERRLGTPASTAAGLLVGALAMAVADRVPETRGADEADSIDGLWLGAAQACALVPGVSRSGATLAAARYRGFRAPDARRLSAAAGLPVIGGAAGLKAMRSLRRRPRRGEILALAAGAGSSFGSTLLAARMVKKLDRNRSLLPYAVYRAALALLILMRLRQETGRRRQV